MASNDPPGTSRPLFHTTPEDQGPTVAITSIVLLITTFLSTVVRLAEILTKKRRVIVADGIILISNTLALAQVISLNLAVSYGLGKHVDKVIESHSLQRYYVMDYATSILSVSAQASAKFSVIAFGHLTHPHWSIFAQRTIIIAVSVWALFGILGVAFACGLPRPWDYARHGCRSSALAINVTIGVLNVITDAYLALFMVPALRKLTTQPRVRLTLIAFFTPRLLVCAPQITVLVLLPGVFSSNDPTWSQSKPQIAYQVLISLSIITANLPSMKRLIYALQTGHSDTRLTERQEAQLGLADSFFTPPGAGSSTISPPTSYRSVFFFGRRIRGESGGSAGDGSATSSQEKESKHDSTRITTGRSESYGSNEGCLGQKADCQEKETCKVFERCHHRDEEGPERPGIWRNVDVQVEVKVEISEEAEDR